MGIRLGTIGVVVNDTGALKRIDSVDLNHLDPGMTNVFFSYSHQDRESAAKITRALADRHVPVWSDQNLRGGAEWEREIVSVVP